MLVTNSALLAEAAWMHLAKMVAAQNKRIVNETLKAMGWKWWVRYNEHRKELKAGGTHPQRARSLAYQKTLREWREETALNWEE